MSEFGDYDPADAWDPEDPPHEQVANLLRRLAGHFDGNPTADLAEVLLILDDLAAVSGTPGIAEDVAFVRDRL